MSEAYDYKPATHWAGHDFKDARASYDSSAKRSYSDAVKNKKTKKDLLAVNLQTKSSAPLVVIIDVTGSMDDWPGTIFSKLPYLDHELRTEYLGEDSEVCFAAVGDANNNPQSDEYPLQVRPFTSRDGLKKALGELVNEHGGGGQTHESYELAALYFARQVEMPRAIRPILIFIGDEQPYDMVDRDQAKNIVGIDLKKGMTDEQVFTELKAKFEVYLIRKPYQLSRDNTMSDIDRRIYSHWARLLGDDHIADLSDPQRVVDVIFGILAKEAGKIDYFRKEIEERQKPKQVGVVYKSLDTIYKLSAPETKSLPKKGHSQTHTPLDGKKTKPLLGE